MRGFILAAALSASGVAAAGDRVEEARARVLTDEYQRELPNGATAPAQEGSAQGESWTIDTRDERHDEIGPLGAVLNYLMWGVVIVGGALAAFWLAIELAKYGGDDAVVADAAVAAAEPDLRVIERPLGDAEEYARRGDFAGAIHTLLLRTLQELVRSSAVRVAPSLTSREILARVPLQPVAREALADLITAVEVTHFGSDPAGAADYERCRAQFQRFAAAFRGRA